MLQLVFLSLCGCHSIVTVNLGSSSHEAAALGKELPPEVMCAALASPGKKLDKLQIDALETCLEMQAKPKAAKHE
jgi:hypothetical protein